MSREILTIVEDNGQTLLELMRLSGDRVSVTVSVAGQIPVGLIIPMATLEEWVNDEG